MTQWILSSSLLIAAVLLIRKIAGDRLSARLRYALWALVLLRLLVPGSVGESALSVQNWTAPKETRPAAVTVLPNETIQTELPAAPVQQPQTQAPVADRSMQLDLLKLTWLAGCCVVGAVFAVSNLRFALRLRRSRIFITKQTLPVYETSAVDTPCMFGLLRPAVYLTPEVLTDQTAQQHVLAHELTHYRHGDHLWSLLRCVCVTVHWYNPLVWLAVFASQQDAELACDEGALRRMDDSARTAYARTLLGLSCGGYRGMLTTATSMTGSKSDLKKRIVRIAKNPRMTAAAAIVTAAALLLTGCAVFTDAKAPAIEGLWRMEVSYLGVGDTESADAYMEYEFFEGRGTRTDYINGEIRSAECFTYSLGEQTVSLVFESAAEPMNYNWTVDGDTLTLSAKRGELHLTRAERDQTDFLPDGYWEVQDAVLTYPKEFVLAKATTTQKAQLLALLRQAELTDTRTEELTAQPYKCTITLTNGTENIKIGLACGPEYVGDDDTIHLSNGGEIDAWVYSLLMVGKFNEKMETSGFVPADMTGIASARMILYGRVFYADPAQLAFLEELLTTAVDMGYPTGCPFEGYLEMTLSNGRVLAVVPALDSCSVFMIGDTCYEYGNRFAYDDEGSYDNTELLAVFGLNQDIIMELWEAQFSSMQGEAIGTTEDIGDVVRVQNDVMEPAYLTDEGRETMIALLAQGIGDTIGREELTFDTTYYIIYSSGLESEADAVTLSDNGSLYIDGVRYALDHSDAILELLEGAYQMRITLNGYNVDELNGSIGEFLYPELCGAPVGEITWYSSEENVCVVEGDAYGATITVTGVGSAAVTAQCRDKNGTVTSDTITILGRESW